MKKILIHGSGHKADSWNKVIVYMNNEDILCPNLSEILNGKEESYDNLYNSFVEYCNKIDGKVDLCVLSLGGILALNYAIDYPDKIEKLVLIGTPHKVPKVIFTIQNIIFKFLPKKLFETMAFNRVQNIKCPTLIICGEKDNANIQSAHYLAENIENVKLEIMKNTGHIVNEEKPDELSKLIIDFWKK